MELTASVAALARVARRVAAEQLRRVGEIDRRGAYAASGYRSTEALLGAVQGLSRGEATAETETARGLEHLPHTRDKLAAGDLGVGPAGVAGRTAAHLNAQLPDETDETAHSQALAELDALAAHDWAGLNRTQVKHAAAAWRGVLDERFLVDRERRAERDRGLTLGDAATPGWLRLSQHGRALVTAALEPLARPKERGDARSLAQRTHDALVELCQRHLDAGALPDVAAQRPHVILTRQTSAGPEAAADAADAATGPGHPAAADAAGEATAAGGHPAAAAAAAHPGAAWLDGVGPISTTAAELIICDGEVTETATDTRGQPLVTTEPRKATKKQRLTVLARDVTCIGCGAPAARCQLHHIIWRRYGGATIVANLTLICHGCHWHIHYDGHRVIRKHGRLRLRPPTATDPPNGRHPPDEYDVADGEP